MPKTIEAWRIKLKKMNDDKVLHDYRICPECLKMMGNSLRSLKREAFWSAPTVRKNITMVKYKRPTKKGGPLCSNQRG